MPITFKRAGQEAVTLENVSFKGVALDKVTFKRAGHEAVTVFEKITQLATPQNVSANGATVSWDAVENATSYAVLADGNEIGTVEAAANLISFTIEGTSYQAEEGMTWEEWVNSSYNTDWYSVSDNEILTSGTYRVGYESKYVDKTDKIINGREYVKLGGISG